MIKHWDEVACEITISRLADDAIAEQAIDAVIAEAEEDQMKARVMDLYIMIQADYNLADCRVLETYCCDYDAYVALPRVVEKDGAMFGLTGWNSDRRMAYYKSTAVIAIAR